MSVEVKKNSEYIRDDSTDYTTDWRLTVSAGSTHSVFYLYFSDFGVFTSFSICLFIVLL